MINTPEFKNRMLREQHKKLCELRSITNKKDKNKILQMLKREADYDAYLDLSRLDDDEYLKKWSEH